ncbi:hypothetical protein [Streptomyces sp. NPDC002851]
MRTSSKTKAALLTAAVGISLSALAACGQSDAPTKPAGSPQASSPAEQSPQGDQSSPATPAASQKPSNIAPSGKPSKPSTAKPASGKPDVRLTKDRDAAMKELSRLQKTGWHNPNKIEYSDDPVTALQQFKRWLDKDYIAPNGGWTPKGIAAVEKANNGGPEL